MSLPRVAGQPSNLQHNQTSRSVSNPSALYALQNNTASSSSFSSNARRETTSGISLTQGFRSPPSESWDQDFLFQNTSPHSSPPRARKNRQSSLTTGQVGSSLLPSLLPNTFDPPSDEEPHWDSSSSDDNEEPDVDITATPPSTTVLFTPKMAFKKSITSVSASESSFRTTPSVVSEDGQNSNYSVPTTDEGGMRPSVKFNESWGRVSERQVLQMGLQRASETIVLGRRNRNGTVSTGTKTSTGTDEIIDWEAAFEAQEVKERALSVPDANMKLNQDVPASLTSTSSLSVNLARVSDVGLEEEEKPSAVSKRRKLRKKLRPIISRSKGAWMSSGSLLSEDGDVSSPIEESSSDLRSRMAFAEDSGDDGVRRQKRDATPPLVTSLNGKTNMSRSSLAAIQEHPTVRDVTPPPHDTSARRSSVSTGKSPIGKRVFSGVISDMLHRSGSRYHTTLSPRSPRNNEGDPPTYVSSQKKHHKHSSSTSDIPKYTLSTSGTSSKSSLFSPPPSKEKATLTSVHVINTVTPRPVKRTNSLGRAARALVGVSRPLSIASYISEAPTVRPTSPLASTISEAGATSGGRGVPRRSMHHMNSHSVDGRATTLSQSYIRPQTAIPFGQVDDDMIEEEINRDPVKSHGRRNSLSELKVPSRITSSQARIEEDLIRVKTFANGVEDLKNLRQIYKELISKDLTNAADSKGKRSLQMMRKMDFDKWFEEADLFIDLGDGSDSGNRERTVSLRPSSGTVSSQDSLVNADAQDGQTKEDGNAEAKRRRQEMLGRIFAPPVAHSDDESCSLYSSRTAISIAQDKQSPLTISSVSGSSQVGDPSHSRLHRVRRVGISSIQQFLKTLRLRANEENMSDLDVDDHLSSICQPRHSLSNPPRTPKGSSSDLEDDWDFVGGGRKGSVMTSNRRNRTQSTQTLGTNWSLRGKRFELNTDSLPALTTRLMEVRTKCEACIEELKIMEKR